MSIDDKAIPGINNELNSLSAEERIAWAWEKFGAGLVLSTSFGLQSGVMLDLTLRVSSEIPVIFVDTGYLFPETYQYANELTGKTIF